MKFSSILCDNMHYILFIRFSINLSIFLLFNLTWLHFMSKTKVTRPTYVAFVPTPSVVTFTDVG